jgi:hypothetical protein
MIIASIRFLAKHPDAPMEWREPSQESLARMAGVPVDASIVVAAAWEDVYEPRNVWTRRWFQTMSNACGRGKKAPSAFMMSKSIACGMLFKQAGWEAFDRFMLETPGPATPH